MRNQYQVIRPLRFGLFDRSYWYEIYQYRELFYMFCWREFKARYKQTFLGIGWAVLQPFFTMVIFSLLLNGAGGLKAENDIPYPIYVFSGTLFWQIISASLTRGSSSLVDQKGLLSKIYFPRIYIAVAPITIALADFLCAASVLVGLYFYYGIVPDPAHLVFAPVFVLMGVLTVLGVILWLSALSVDIRDVKHAIPFFAQTWMFLTPVVYPPTVVPEAWRFIYELNPMVGILEGMRWSLLPAAPPPDPGSLMSSFVVTMIILVTGFALFQYRAQTVVDKA